MQYMSGMLLAGKYVYMEDLQTLSSRIPLSSTTSPPDTALPFGLCSAPKIFSALANGLLWIMTQHGIHAALHYLDDYIFMDNTETSECADALKLAV